jgi:putative phage-type endonuclease
MTADIQLIDYETREAWLAARSTGIGASESAALFGVSRWDTLTTLWARKTGRLTTQDAEQTKQLKWGIRLEPAIAAGYEEDSGRKLVRAGQYAVAQHSQLPFMAATPDYWIVSAHDRTGAGLVEIKNVGIWIAKHWDDGVPPYVEIQAQHQMACTGRDYVTVMPLFGGNDDRPLDIERNQAFIDELEVQCDWFWGFVKRDEAPPVDGSERTLEAIKKLHPADNGEQVDLPTDALDWWAQLEGAKATIKGAETMKTDADAHLRDAIGDATYGLLPDGRRLSLKTSSNPGGEHIVAPYTYRTLRLEKAAKGRR